MKKFNQILTLQYPECVKNGLHYGELTNIVCTNNGCEGERISCMVCIEEKHLEHNYKPLKYTINKAAEFLDNLELQSKQAQEACILSLDKHLELCVQNLSQKQKWSSSELEIIISAYRDHFKQIKQQLSAKQQALNSFAGFLLNIQNQQLSFQDFISQSDGLFQYFKITPEGVVPKISLQVTENELDRILKQQNLLIENNLNRIIEQNHDLSSHKIFLDSLLSVSILEGGLFLHFSKQNTHPELSILCSNQIQSIGKDEYKFAIAEPPIKSSTQFAFKMVSGKFTWAAIGICKKSIILQHNFGFKFNKLGHGAYLVASNGGIWSTSNNSKNNLIKSFKFTANDVIIVNYEKEKNSVTFSKKGQKNQTFQHDCIESMDEDYHPCVLFYYPNDVIEVQEEF